MRRLLVVPALFLLFAACGGNDETPEAQQSAEPSGAAGIIAADCVETYSLKTLPNRGFAFDGRIKEIDAPETPSPDGNDTTWLTFDVEHWYKGGDGATTKVRSGTFGAVTTAGSIEADVGDRLLVSGDEDYMWECGFTMPYDAKVAADWETTL